MIGGSISPGSAVLEPFLLNNTMTQHFHDCCRFANPRCLFLSLAPRRCLLSRGIFFYVAVTICDPLLQLHREPPAVQSRQLGVLIARLRRYCASVVIFSHHCALAEIGKSGTAGAQGFVELNNCRNEVPTQFVSPLTSQTPDGMLYSHIGPMGAVARGDDTLTSASIVSPLGHGDRL